MKYDFKALDAQQFENLCAALLAAEGYTQILPFAKPGARDRGIDWIATARTGDVWIVQAKALPRRMSNVEFKRILGDLSRGLSLTGAQHALLATTTTVPSNTIAELGLSSNLHIWDAGKISELLDAHKDVGSAVSHLVISGRVLEQFIARAAERPNTTPHELARRLRGVNPGREDWRAYEDVCIDILNYAFVPPLRIPIIQSKSEDGLDRRDAIYPIGQGNPFWESLKHQYSTRMVVAEFKNYSSAIGQQQVESLQQYLLPKAKRSVGLICSRMAPSESALKARRRAWMVSENIILFLGDEELEKIVEMRAAAEDPSLLLDALMDDFFVELAP